MVTFLGASILPRPLENIHKNEENLIHKNNEEERKWFSRNGKRKEMLKFKWSDNGTWNLT